MGLSSKIKFVVLSTHKMLALFLYRSHDFPFVMVQTDPTLVMSFKC